MKNQFLLVFLASLLNFTQTRGAKVPTFKHLDIDVKIEIGYGLAVADVNGDQKVDVLLVDKNQVVWYEAPSWKKHVITEKLTQLDHVCIAARDLDGDGKAEIAVGAGWNPSDTLNSGAVFYLRPPQDRTGLWEPIELPHEPTVHRMRWVKNGTGKYDLIVVPLHGRGNKAGQGQGVKVLAYHMPNDPKQPWTTATVDQAQHMTHNFNPVQWDDDAAEEMLLAGKEGIFLLDASGAGWKKSELVNSQVSGFQGAGEVRNGRLPNKAPFIATIEPMHGTQAVVYARPEGGAELWKRNVLDSSLNDGHAVACGDILGNGSDQIVVGWRGKAANGKVGLKLFVPLDPAGAKWETTVIDDNQMACEDLLLADLNGDGKLDIVAAGRATKNVKIYLNEGL